MPFVLDNSVVSGWYLGDLANAHSRKIAQRLLEDQAIVPVAWELELANMLRTACRRQRLDAAAAQEILARISDLPIACRRNCRLRSDTLRVIAKAFVEGRHLADRAIDDVSQLRLRSGYMSASLDSSRLSGASGTAPRVD